MENDNTFDVFISYRDRTEDGERTLCSFLAEDIKRRLIGDGHNPFFQREDINRMGSEQYIPLRNDALDSARVLVLLIGDPTDVRSEDVKYEVDRFNKNGRSGIIIPVFKNVLEDAKLRCPTWINDPQYCNVTFDVTDGRDPFNNSVKEFSRLINCIEAILKDSSSRCPVCGNIVEKQDKIVFHCDRCGMVFSLSCDYESQRLLNRALGKRLNMLFQDAARNYQSISDLHKDFRADFGYTISLLGLMYEDIESGYGSPLAFYIEPSRDSLQAIKMLKDSLSYTSEISERELTYLATFADDLERTVNYYINTASAKEWDIYLCSGRSVECRNSTEKLYEKLIGWGYRVFYDAVSLRGINPAFHEAECFRALKASSVMIISGSEASDFLNKSILKTSRQAVYLKSTIVFQYLCGTAIDSEAQKIINEDLPIADVFYKSEENDCEPLFLSLQDNIAGVNICGHQNMELEQYDSAKGKFFKKCLRCGNTEQIDDVADKECADSVFRFCSIASQSKDAVTKEAEKVSILMKKAWESANERNQSALTGKIKSQMLLFRFLYLCVLLDIKVYRTSFDWIPVIGSPLRDDAVQYVIDKYRSDGLCDELNSISDRIVSDVKRIHDSGWKHHQYDIYLNYLSECDGGSKQTVAFGKLLTEQLREFGLLVFSPEGFNNDSLWMQNGANLYKAVFGSEMMIVIVSNNTELTCIEVQSQLGCFDSNKIRLVSLMGEIPKTTIRQMSILHPDHPNAKVLADEIRKGLMKKYQHIIEDQARLIQSNPNATDIDRILWYCDRGATICANKLEESEFILIKAMLHGNRNIRQLYSEEKCVEYLKNAALLGNLKAMEICKKKSIFL